MPDKPMSHPAMWLSDRLFGQPIVMWVVIGFGLMSVNVSPHRLVQRLNSLTGAGSFLGPLPPLQAVAIAGAAVYTLLAGLLAAAWIKMSRGHPFGPSEPEITSSGVHAGRRRSTLFAVGLIVSGLLEIGLAIVRYPNPVPSIAIWAAPEEEALRLLLVGWNLMLVGTFWLVPGLYWAARLRRLERAAERVPVP